MSLAKKLYLLFAVTLIILFSTNLFSSFKLKTVSEDLIDTLYYQTYSSTELILNADRDLYQAIMGQRTLLVVDVDSPMFQKQLDFYTVNIQQTRDRVGKAQQIFEQNRAVAATMIHVDTNETILEKFDLFFPQLEKWEAQSNHLISLLQTEKGLNRQEIGQQLIAIDDHFELSREYLDEIQDIIEEYSANYMEQVEDSNAQLQLWMLIVLVIAGIVFSFFGIALIQNILKSIRTLVHATTRMADGDLTVEEINVRTKDEIGILSQSFNTMTQSLRSLITKISDSSMHVSAASEQLTASAEQANKAVEHIAHSLQEVSEGIEQQKNSVESSLQSIHHVRSDANTIAQNAQQVAHNALDTSTKTIKGNESIQTVIHKMTAINHAVSSLANSIKLLGERSNDIGNIIGVITSISEQTNLLSLNAAIEAARAGEEGKGFAVVANEVRKLADQSAQSANHITSLISEIQNETKLAIESMDEVVHEVETGIAIVTTTGTAFDEIEQSINGVTQKIQEVSNTTQQMTSSTEQVATVIQSIHSIAESSASETQNVSAASEEQLASMEEISASAQALSKLAEDLRHLIQNFKI